MFENYKRNKEIKRIAKIKQDIEYDKSVGRIKPDRSFIRPIINDYEPNKVLCRLIIKAGNSIYGETIEMETFENIEKNNICIGNSILINNCKFKISSFEYQDENHCTIIYYTGLYWAGSMDIFEVRSNWQDISKTMVKFAMDGWKINKWEKYKVFPLTDY